MQRTDVVALRKFLRYLRRLALRSISLLCIEQMIIIASREEHEDEVCDLTGGGRWVMRGWTNEDVLNDGKTESSLLQRT